ncbi:hypothetical protein BH10PSE3_BH10PSE3_11670 [soil metagenome]|jgi:hypothetical protein
MKKIILTAVIAAAAFAGAAHAGTAPTAAYLQAARCRGLATSQGLGAVDVTNIDAFMKQEGSSLDAKTRFGVGTKISNAQKEANRASGAAKDRLLAERAGVCSTYLGAAATGAAVNTSN